jgi:hypothetical protein
MFTVTIGNILKLYIYVFIYLGTDMFPTLSVKFILDMFQTLSVKFILKITRDRENPSPSTGSFQPNQFKEENTASKLDGR